MANIPIHRQSNHKPLNASDLELIADVMKERIYASLALLAVLISIDANHTSIGHVALLVGGTSLSLWAASGISAQMARRMVYGEANIDQLNRDKQKHAPLLASAVLPLLLVGLSALNIVPLNQAISISIFAILLSLVVWSVASARSMNASKTATLILSGIVLLVGLCIVGLKAFLEH
jgi:hypothetical protein